MSKILISTKVQRQILAQKTYLDTQIRKLENQKKAKRDADSFEFDNWDRIAKKTRR